MKPSLIAIIIFSSAILLIQSCKKDDPTTVSPSPKANEITTQIDGVPWSGDILSWAVSGGVRQINANATDGTLMQIFMPVDTTGVFDASDNLVTVSYYDGVVTWSNNVSGQVTITANSDDHVEGTFDKVIASFFNSDTLNFTAGSFHFK